MDSERAETHLRLLAEAELRRVIEPAKPGEFVVHGQHAQRLRRVAQALIKVGALDADSADEIMAAFEFAVAIRQLNPRGRAAATSAVRSPAVRRRLGRLTRTSSYPVPAPGANPGTDPRPAPERVVPVGMMISVRDADAWGELYLLAYLQTAAGARFTVTASLRGLRVLPHPNNMVNGLAATDDRGHAYMLNFSGSAHDATRWTGVLGIHPDPPSGIRWLDLTGRDSPPRRISLEPPDHPPTITVTEMEYSPGERLLHSLAAQILVDGVSSATVASGAAVGLSGRVTRLSSGWARLDKHVTAGLGDTVDALLAAGALSPLSPVPGQLAMLCESLDVRDHGIAAAPVRELPKPWMSLLSYAHRRKREAVTPRPGCAGAAVALPELDGVKISIVGLHADENGTVLHIHASGGTPPDLDGEASFLPVFWLRDEYGRWHTTHATSCSIDDNGEATAQLRIVPPLPPGTSVEVVIAGTSAEVRTTLRLDWR